MSHVLPTKPVAEQSHQYLQSITGLINTLTHKLDSFTYNDNIGIRTSNSGPFTATAAAALILLWFFKLVNNYVSEWICKAHHRYIASALDVLLLRQQEL